MRSLLRHTIAAIASVVMVVTLATPAHGAEAAPHAVLTAEDIPPLESEPLAAPESTFPEGTFYPELSAPPPLQRGQGGPVPPVTGYDPDTSTELPDERDEFSNTYVNKDGTYGSASRSGSTSLLPICSEAAHWLDTGGHGHAQAGELSEATKDDHAGIASCVAVRRALPWPRRGGREAAG